MKVCYISSICMTVVCAGMMCIELMHGDLRGHLHGLLCFVLVIYYMVASGIFYKEIKKNEHSRIKKYPELM